MKNLTEKLKQVNERLSSEQIWDAFEKMKDAMGAEALLNELAQALSIDELESNLKFIDKNNELHIIR